MEPYSKYWRINRSRHESVELALALKALQKVAGHLGRNVRPVYWQGMVASDNRYILLDPGNMKGAYPISPAKFDRLVGQVVLEGLSSIEWREMVIDRVLNNFSNFEKNAAAYLESLLHAAEDIYIYERTGPTVWRYYLSKLFKKNLLKNQRDPSLPPRPESLADIWRKNMIIGTLPAPSLLHPYYWETLKVLSNITASIRGAVTLPTAAKRRKVREEIYIEMGNRIFEVIIKWEPFFLSPDGVGITEDAGIKSDEPSENPDKEDPPKENSPQDNGEGLEKDLADEINDIIDEGITDLSETIKVAVEDPEVGSMPTTFQKGVAGSHIVADKTQVKRLKSIFREQAAMIRRSQKFRKQKRLSQGQLDARRLYRHAIDGKIFKNKEREKPDHLWQICILADASSSMGATVGRLEAWEIAEKTFAALAEAVKGTDNKLDIYAYAEERNECLLTRLYHGGQLYSVVPGGRTPSGQAILASAIAQKPSGGKRILIHITDGAANCGISISEALRYCSANDIEVFNIGCGCTKQTIDFLSQNFPDGNLFFLKNINFLSAGFELLFRQNLYGTRSGVL